MASQAEMYEALRAATDPAEKRDHALALLAATRSREYVDAALRTLLREDVRGLLGDAHRATLRDRALYYFDNEDKDRGGLIREQITQALAAIGHPGDEDIYLKGVAAYYRQPVTDSAQNLRAAALRALVAVNAGLGSAYAVRLLGEPDTSPLNGEPSITALGVLAMQSQPLPIYQFILLRGEDFIRQGLGDVVGKALELLGADFPTPLYASLAEWLIELDAPTASSGLVNAIVAARLTALYPLLEDLIAGTRHDDLHRYAVIELAASRDETLIALLYDLARLAPKARIMNYLEAVELTAPGSSRDRLITALERQL